VLDKIELLFTIHKGLNSQVKWGQKIRVNGWVSEGVEKGVCLGECYVLLIALYNIVK
jgi:hypothetical protein